MAGLVALVPLPARGQAVESIVGGTRLDRCLPVCGCGRIGRGLRAATDSVEFAHARFLGVIGLGLRIATDPVGITLSVTGRDLLTTTGLGKSVCDLLLVGELAVTACGQAIPLVALVTARGHA